MIKHECEYNIIMDGKVYKSKDGIVELPKEYVSDTCKPIVVKKEKKTK